VLITAADGRVLGANTRACDLLGRTDPELIELGWDEVLDRRSGSWEEALETHTRHGAFRGVCRLRRGDGSTFAAEVTSATILDEGSPRAYVSLRYLDTAEAEAAQAGACFRAAAEVVDSLEAISHL
jgi:PAS domain S-box-containing protein